MLDYLSVLLCPQEGPSSVELVFSRSCIMGHEDWGCRKFSSIKGDFVIKRKGTVCALVTAEGERGPTGTKLAAKNER